MTHQELIANFQRLDVRTRQRLGIVLAALLIVVVTLSAINSRISALEKKRRAREADVTEMMRLKIRYQGANAVAQRMANRLASTKLDDSPAKVIDEIGIKGRGVQVKPVKGDDIPGYQEDAADIRIDALTANELTNLLFRLEKGTRPVTVKKALIKQRFDDPSKLDVTLTVALIKPAPAATAR
ncbi:type II secretion system protein GspM [Geomonas sp. Red276]